MSQEQQQQQHDVPVDEAKRVLNEMEDYFADPEVTSRISTFMNLAVDAFADVEDDNDPRIHDNYKIFAAYSAMLDDVLDDFATKHKIEAEVVAKACVAEMSDEANHATSYLCAPYIDAACSFERFVDLVEDTAGMVNFGDEEEQEQEQEQGREQEEGEACQEQEGVSKQREGTAIAAETS